MISLPYGQLPTRAQWDEAFKQASPNGTYNIQLSTAESRACGVYSLGDGCWLCNELWDAANEIVRDDNPDEDAMGVVASILRTLGFDWARAAANADSV